MEISPYRTTEQRQPKNIAELLAIIEFEGKFGILLPKKVNLGSEIEQLTRLNNLNSQILYKDIVLYSEGYGILRLNQNRDPQQDYTEKPVNFVQVEGANTKIFFDFIDENNSTMITITYNPLAKNFTINTISNDPTKIKAMFKK